MMRNNIPTGGLSSFVVRIKSSFSVMGFYLADFTNKKNMLNHSIFTKMCLRSLMIQKKSRSIFVFKKTGLLFGFLMIGWFCVVNSVYPQEKNLSKRVSLAFEVGNWQPHSLNDEPRFDTFGAAGATPFMGFALSTPFVWGMGLRLSVGYWSLRDLEEVESVHSLTLHPLSLDVKYWFVPDYRLSAYVMYGGGVYWGVENETEPFGEKLSKARAGWGASLGAGFDLLLTRRAGLGMAFQYHFVRFKEPLGGVDDFSGPKITTMVFIFL